MKATSYEQLARSRREHITEIVEYLKAGDYVFVTGPDGLGKSKVITEAVDLFLKNKNIKRFKFDMDEAFEKGPHKFYGDIIEKISGNPVEMDMDNVSDISRYLIDALDKQTTEPTLLVFDNFKTLEQDFYYRFSKDCRKIFTEGDHRPDSGLSKICMLFCGSLVAWSEDNTTSPLWNVTEKIEIFPMSEKESKKMINLHWNKIGKNSPSNNIRQLIHDCAQGYVLLTISLMRFINKNGNSSRFKNKRELINEFGEYIWTLGNRPPEPLEQEHEKKLRNHFSDIVEYLKTSPDILRTVFDRLKGELVQGPTSHNIDHISISGMIRKDGKGYYSISNEIYFDFLNRLLLGPRGADFCLFHIGKENLWETAIGIYQEYCQQKNKSDATSLFSPRLNHSAHLINKLVAHLRTFSDIEQIVQETKNIIFFVFDISTWGIFEIEGNECHGAPDKYFMEKLDWGAWVTEEEFNQQIDFINKSVIKSQTPMFDWTGQWLAVPVMIRENFNKLFLAKIKPEQKEWHQMIIDFVQGASRIYYHTRARNREQKQITDLRRVLKSMSNPSESFREKRAQKFWELSKPIFENLGIGQFTLHEVLNGVEIISTESHQKKLNGRDSCIKFEDTPILQEVIAVLETGKIYHRYGESLHFIGKFMKYSEGISGNAMIIEFDMDQEKYAKKKQAIEDIFEFFRLSLYHGLDISNHLQMLKQTFSASSDYAYVVNEDYNIIFVNDNMRALIEKQSLHDSIEGTKCYKTIMGNEDPCVECQIKNMMESKEAIHITKERTCDNKTSYFDATFAPLHIKSIDGFSPVAIFLHDLRDNKILIESLQEMENIDTLEKMGNFILETLMKFGFKRGYQYRYDPAKAHRFILEDIKGLKAKVNKDKEFKDGDRSFENDDKYLLAGHVGVWYRNGTPKDELRILLEDRLRDSGFGLKESRSAKSYNSKEERPDFWITVPIMSRSGIIKLYSMNNGVDDSQLCKKLITLDKLQALETFAFSAGQALENMQKRYQYLDRQQAMLAHSTREPLQITRMMLHKIAKTSDLETRAHLIKVSDGALSLAQSTLKSLLVIEKGASHIDFKETNINDLLLKQSGIFTAYADTTGIKFDIVIPDKDIFFSTDMSILALILNNLLGNAIRYLQKFKREEKSIRLQASKKGSLLIKISDNGPGLPEQVKKYLNQPFRKESPYPGDGFGIGFSREMANMLRGDLSMDKKSFFDTGTTFCLDIGGTSYGKKL